jgi:hypothetical protein
MAYPGSAQYKINFELSPIILTGGIAANFVGGMLPLIAITQSGDFESILSGGAVDLDDVFANFYPMPGTSLVDNQIGNYPFANMAVAANAIIAQPLVCSLMMRCPCRDAGDYARKTAIMTSLQNTLKAHNTLGGTYTVATPSFTFNNTILKLLSDISGGESLQAQMAWKWDFIKPLVTLQDAYIQYNSMMQSLVNGTATQGNLSGAAGNVGAPQSVIAPSVAPSAAASSSASIPATPSGTLPQ